MKHILVTGGAGYVGAVLVPKLLAQGHRVRVLDLFLFADESLFAGAPADRLSIFRADLRERERVEKALEGIDVVVHLAGISNDPCSDLNPALTRAVNVDATCWLIDEARKRNIERFINASSSSVYGIKEEDEVTEDLPLTPLTVYSESKVAVERYLARNRGEMAAISIRSATVCGYSPRMRLDLTVNILTHHAVTRNQITVFGGTQKRPNIHIEDITDLYARLVTMPRMLIDGKQLNACGENHQVKEIAELVKCLVAPTARIEIAPTNDLRSYHICARRIERELGFLPRRSMGDAIRDVAAAFRKGKIPTPESDVYYNVKTLKARLSSERRNGPSEITPELSSN